MDPASDLIPGLLTAFLGVALDREVARGGRLSAVVVSLAIKSRAEEVRMRATFPEYERYRRESWAIVPGVY